MATRQQRLNEFDGDGEPPPGEPIELLSKIIVAPTPSLSLSSGERRVAQCYAQRIGAPKNIIVVFVLDQYNEQRRITTWLKYHLIQK